MKKLLILMIVLVLPIKSLASKTIAFIGLSGNNAPSLEKGYEQQLRERLSMEENLNASDYLECQKFRRIIKFDDYPEVSQKHLETLVNFSNDSTMILWAAVKNFEITPKRKKIFCCGIQGQLQIVLHLYNLSKKEFLFVGDITAFSFKPKSIGIFKIWQPISANERSELIEMLQTEAVNNSCRIISAAIRTEKNDLTDTGSSNEEPEKGPSITDVFTIPSAEPAQIEPESQADSVSKNRKK